MIMYKSRAPNMNPTLSNKSPYDLRSRHSSIYDETATNDFYSVHDQFKKRLAIVTLSVIFAIFGMVKSTRLFLLMVIKWIIVLLVIYLLNFFFYKKGGRAMTETFMISAVIASIIYFVLRAPFPFFSITFFVCIFLAFMFGAIPSLIF